MKLIDCDQTGLLDLVEDLYAASKDNQTFLHTRFGLNGDALEPYKTVITRWLWPDIDKNQNTSVAKAKKAISDYTKAIGKPADIAELSVFYCEQAAGFCYDVGLQDENYFSAWVRMFEQALKGIAVLPQPQQKPLWKRLDAVREMSHHFGYGLGDELDGLLAQYDIEDPI